MKIRSVKLNIIWIIFLIGPLSLTVAFTQSSSPNILFLLADDLRADCISAFGNSQIETPNIDLLIERGMAFTQATCSSPICNVSRAEILTGMHGWENGMSGMGRPQPLPEHIESWPEAFKNEGYNTWVVGKWHVRGRPSSRGYIKTAGLFSGGGSKYWIPGQKDWKGFPITGYKGWIFQSDDGKTLYPNEGIGLTPDINQKFADSAIVLIKNNHSKPWMGHVNFTAPHDPLLMPPDMAGKYHSGDMAIPKNFQPEHPFDHGNFSGRDEELLAWPRTESAVKDLLRVYYSVVENLDAQIGRIMAFLKQTGQLDNTIIVFSSDHGIAVGSHGLRGKQNQYEHTINVPLIICGPGIEPGSQTDAQVYLRELYPTTCELVGINIPRSVTAKSFLKILEGKTDVHHNYIFGYYFDSQRMIRSSDGWKLIYYTKIDYWQLFDLNNDRDERHNLMGSGKPEHREKYEELKRELIKWRQRQGDPLDIK